MSGHPIDPRIRELIDRGALFVLNHSGGKDSQAMTGFVRAIVPDDQIVVIHADLGDVEWPGLQEHILHTTPGLPLIVAKAVDRAGRPKGFFDLVDSRGMFPSPKQRQCTSDLKRGPCEREIRRYLKAAPRFNGLVVNCMGMRAEESSDRARRAAFAFNANNSKAGREWYDWLPIQDWLLDEVWAFIAKIGQRRHWAYDLGMSRLSCCFCIMAAKADLIIAAKHRPDLFGRYVEKERELGFTLQAGKTLEETTGRAVTTELAA